MKTSMPLILCVLLFGCSREDPPATVSYASLGESLHVSYEGRSASATPKLYHPSIEVERLVSLADLWHVEVYPGKHIIRGGVEITNVEERANALVCIAELRGLAYFSQDLWLCLPGRKVRVRPYEALGYYISYGNVDDCTSYELRGKELVRRLPGDYDETLVEQPKSFPPPPVGRSHAVELVVPSYTKMGKVMKCVQEVCDPDCRLLYLWFR